VDIETGSESLVINELNSRFTGYPFEEKGKFITEDKGLQRIWETGWRTARLCAMDTYMDCPYYEQLQYVGDTRIQAMISLYVAGDDRLMKKAISDIAHSFIADGLTQSRYPSRDLQVIPTFSLWWVCMIHDLYMHRKDDAFIREQLNGVENVLRWYEEKMASNGILGSLSWWQFVDWSWPWVDSIRVGGVPPGVSKGGSAIVSLQ
jgi:alpha-L-rhamnosidase